MINGLQHETYLIYLSFDFFRTNLIVLSKQVNQNIYINNYENINHPMRRSVLTKLIKPLMEQGKI